MFAGDVAPAAQSAALKRAASALPDARIGPLQPAGRGVSFAQIDTRLEPQPARCASSRCAARSERGDRGQARDLRANPACSGRCTSAGRSRSTTTCSPCSTPICERGEAIAIPIAVLVLLVVFGTLTATLVPLLMAAGTVPVTLGAAVARSRTR